MAIFSTPQDGVQFPPRAMRRFLPAARRTMTGPARTVDLRGEGASRVQGAAYAALRELRPGDAVTLLTATEPTLLMRSLDLHLRHRLSWTMVQQTGGWRVEVRHRDAEPARAGLHGRVRSAL